MEVFLTGPSVRKTRIERLWRDVVKCAVSVFSSIFLFLEDHLFLDTGDGRDMYALHYIFIPRIPRLLDRFTMNSITIQHELSITELHIIFGPLGVCSAIGLPMLV